MPGSGSIKLGVDDFQFVIGDAEGAELSGPELGGNELVYFDRQIAPFAIVSAGAPWGRVRVTYRTCTEAVTIDPAPQWDEVVEVSLVSASGLMVSGLTGGPGVQLTDVGGAMRVRVSAQGRQESQALSYQRLSRTRLLPEQYLIECWPAAVAPTRVLRAKPVEPAEDAEPGQHEAPGRAAALRLRAMLAGLDNRRRLIRSGPAVLVEATLSGRCREYFAMFTSHFTWLTNSGGPGELRRGERFWFRRLGDPIEVGVPDDIVPADGAVGARFIDFRRPGYVVMSWNWLVPISPDKLTVFDLTPVLDEPSELRLDFSDGGDGATTAVRLVHSGLPASWVAVMHDYWRWQLERAETINTSNF